MDVWDNMYGCMGVHGARGGGATISYTHNICMTKNTKMPKNPTTRVSNTDQYGEVFTPPELIDELLDHLPKNIWSDPELRWLDPCAGEGNFFDRVVPRLMEGLREAIPGEAARRRHILGTMLTMVEINPTNLRILRKKYGRDGAGARILAGDFLDDAVVAVDPSGTRYDVILANPPYQAPKHEVYVGSAGNRTLWDAFIRKADGLRSPRGVQGWITPANWRRPEHPLFPLLYDRLLYLRIYGKSAGLALFGVQTRFDIYVTAPQADPSRPIPLLVDEGGETHRAEIVPQDWPFYPNAMYGTFRRILVRPGQEATEGLVVIHDSSLYDARKLTKRATTRHRYPVIHTLTAEGRGIRYAETRSREHFGVPKVILNVNEKQYPVNDFTGKYGLSQLSFALPIRSRTEGERIVAAIASPVFQDILKASRWGSFQTDHRMFRYFRKDWVERLTAQGNRKLPRQPGTRRRRRIPTVLNHRHTQRLGH